MANSLKEVELFAAGTWNGMRFSKDDLEEFVTSYQALEGILKIPLKMGHNNEQPLTDGQPALGWVSNVKVKAGKLVADFTDLPDIVYNAIKKKLYNTLSIELFQDVEYKKNKFPFVLSGVALLGADLPAVNVLSDLSAYMSSDVKFANSVQFTLNQEPTEEGDIMSKELEARIAALEGQLKASNDSVSELTGQLATSKAQAAEFKTKSEALVLAQTKAAFSTKKDALVVKLDNLVKGDLITPAQRDAFTAQIKDGDMASIDVVQSTYDALTAGIDVTRFSTQEVGQKSLERVQSEGDPSQMLAEKVATFRTTPEGAGLSFSAAKERVFAANPGLARDYIQMTGEI